MTARARRLLPRPRRRVWEEPERDVMRRWREHGHGFAELDCGHVEPGDDLPMATRLRCRQCLPVRVLPPAPQESRW